MNSYRWRFAKDKLCNNRGDCPCAACSSERRIMAVMIDYYLAKPNPKQELKRSWVFYHYTENRGKYIDVVVEQQYPHLTGLWNAVKLLK